MKTYVKWIAVGAAIALPGSWILCSLQRGKPDLYEKQFNETIKKLGDLGEYCKKFKDFTGGYPKNFNSLRSVMRITNNSVFTDAWGHAFILFTSTNATSARLTTYGADGKPGGTGSNADGFMELK